MKPIIAVPATLALVYRAWSHKSLTPLGIVVAASTAAAHAAHPWNLPFALLVVFFLAGTRATKVKKDVKATLTLSAQGNSGGEGPRTHIQVLANSAMATILALLHAHQLRQASSSSSLPGTAKSWLFGGPENTQCFSMGRGGTTLANAGDVLIVGIIANYAAVAADTFSSELGILSRSQPRLITSWSLRKVPRGTNGGVTVWGLAAGLMGSVIVVTASMLFLPICNITSSTGNTTTSVGDKIALFGGLAVWGALGSVLDSFLGGWFQRSVRDARTGKIVEGDGGLRVLVAPPPPSSSSSTKPGPSAAQDGLTDHQNQVPSTDDNDGSGSSTAVKHKRTADVKARLLNGEGKDAVEIVPNSTGPTDSSSTSHGHPTRVVETGHDFLDNNQVNFLMAFIMSVGGMAIAASAWGVPLASVLSLGS